MQLMECYEIMGGNFQDVMGRLQSEALVKRFAIKFLSDPSFGRLKEAVAEKNYSEAFRASHSLKGVSQNLSFDKLGESSAKLTELLRHWDTVPVDDVVLEEYYAQVAEDYKVVTDVLKQYQDQ